MSNKDLLIRWLNNAHMMENHLIPVLENHAKDMKKNPSAQQRIRQHIDETRRHSERVERCLGLLGASPSSAKSTLASLMGSAQAVSTGLFKDELVKNALSDYATEQFEVACYKALMIAARESGQSEIARECEENMREDEAMATWLDQQLPTVVQESLEPVGAH
ncbi:MAG TPA: ferritin-like domain-containing protein [Vicinamibacterales bacterium]